MENKQFDLENYRQFVPMVNRISREMELPTYQNAFMYFGRVILRAYHQLKMGEDINLSKIYKEECEGQVLYTTPKAIEERVRTVWSGTPQHILEKYGIIKPKGLVFCVVQQLSDNIEQADNVHQC